MRYGAPYPEQPIDALSSQSMTSAFALVATDLDGTLLRSDLSVSRRTRAVLDALRARGVLTVPVTARQPHGLSLIAQAAGFEHWALCSNGALCLDLTTGKTLFSAHLEVEFQRALAQALLRRQPDTVFVSIRGSGEVFVAQNGYAALAAYGDHKREPDQMQGASLDEVLSQPSLKLAARHPRLSPQELFDEVSALRAEGLGGFAVTMSGAPFLEFMKEGLSKAWGLEKLCRHLGLAAAQVVAFGDALNDAEMLAWAGHGVAMAQAPAQVQASAQEVTLSSDDDGVAVVLERMLAQGQFG